MSDVLVFRHWRFFWQLIDWNNTVNESIHHSSEALFELKWKKIIRKNPRKRYSPTFLIHESEHKMKISSIFVNNDERFALPVETFLCKQNCVLVLNTFWYSLHQCFIRYFSFFALFFHVFGHSIFISHRSVILSFADWLVNTIQIVWSNYFNVRSIDQITVTHDW